MHLIKIYIARNKSRLVNEIIQNKTFGADFKTQKMHLEARLSSLVHAVVIVEA